MSEYEEVLLFQPNMTVGSQLCVCMRTHTYVYIHARTHNTHKYEYLYIQYDDDRRGSKPLSTLTTPARPEYFYLLRFVCFQKHRGTNLKYSHSQFDSVNDSP